MIWRRDSRTNRGPLYGLAARALDLQWSNRSLFGLAVMSLAVERPPALIERLVTECLR